MHNYHSVEWKVGFWNQIAISLIHMYIIRPCLSSSLMHTCASGWNKKSHLRYSLILKAWLASEWIFFTKHWYIPTTWVALAPLWIMRESVPCMVLPLWTQVVTTGGEPVAAHVSVMELLTNPLSLYDSHLSNGPVCTVTVTFSTQKAMEARTHY